MLVCGDALCQFDLVSSDAKNTETLLDLDYRLQGLAWYFPCKLTKKKHVMRRCEKIHAD